MSQGRGTTLNEEKIESVALFYLGRVLLGFSWLLSEVPIFLKRWRCPKVLCQIHSRPLLESGGQYPI